MEVRNYQYFADLVKALRRQHRLSQRAMAKVLRVSPGYVGQWELRLSQPSAEVAAKLCQLFDIADVEYVQRLAYAERAPAWLKQSIIYGTATTAPAELSPLEQRVLQALRRLPERLQTRLMRRMEAWADADASQAEIG